MQIITTNNNFYNFRANTLSVPPIKKIQKSVQKPSEPISNFKVLKSINNNPNNINDLTMEKVGEYLKAHSNSLPSSISPILLITGNFLSKKINVDTYQKVIEDLDKKLQNRLIESDSAKAFKKNYSTELRFIEEIKNANKNFSENKIDEKELDNTIEKLTKNYLTSPRNREKIFVY